MNNFSSWIIYLKFILFADISQIISNNTNLPVLFGQNYIKSNKVTSYSQIDKLSPDVSKTFLFEISHFLHAHPPITKIFGIVVDNNVKLVAVQRSWAVETFQTYFESYDKYGQAICVVIQSTN